MKLPFSAKNIVPVLLLLGFGAPQARADCANQSSGLSAGVCAAQRFDQADTAMNEMVQQLNAVLPKPALAALGPAQTKFLERRLASCTKSAGGALFIDYPCADRLTRARLLVLQSLVSEPVPAVGQNGHYTVPGTAMPWLWTPGGMNSAEAFGRRDGTGPIVLALAQLNPGPGQRLIIRYVSGKISAGPNLPPEDANGTASAYDHGGKGPSGGVLPSTFLRPTPIHLGALVGAFTDPAGVLVGPPFALGDGPDLVTVPAGAAQLQLGINLDAAASALGSLTISVTVAPENIAGYASGPHGCAVFGGSAGSACASYPAWTSGLWLPPPGTGELHVLAVGGGGGGGLANLSSGVGGAGGGSGKVVVADMPIQDSPIEIAVGQGGTGAHGGSQAGGGGGTGSIFGDVVANGGWGGQPSAGGSAAGAGGNNGGGGGGGGTYQASYDAGAGGIGGTGGTSGSDGAPPTDIEAGWNGSAGGAGTAFPDFDFADLVFGAGPGGAGGGFGSGGLTAAGVSCAGGGGGGGGGGGVLINNAGPRAPSTSGPALPWPCGTPGVTGQGGLGYGAGGGGAGAGLAGPTGNGANGVVYVEW